MTEARRLWREDEGHKSVTSPSPPQDGGDIFGPSERSKPKKKDERIQLWREDEGRPVQPVAPTPSPAPRPKRRAVRIESTRRSLSLPLVLLLTLALIGVVAGVDAVWSVLTIRDRLSAVSDRLADVETSLSRGDLSAAEGLARDALEAGSEAQSAAERPALVLASLLPELDREADAIRNAARAGRLSAEAAAAIVDGAADLGLDEDGTPQALYEAGRVQLDTLAAARADLNAAEIALTNAVLRLEPLQPRLNRIEQPISDALAEIREVLPRITKARTLLDLLPPLLGGDETRRYLLAFQAPGEARGTGGLVGMVGVLEAKDGRLELKSSDPSSLVFDRTPRVDAPPWFEEAYESQRALEQFQQANVSPNFPIVSEILLDMYEGGGARPDGVLAMDPIALSFLMEGLGPIETTRPARTVDAGNVAEVLLRDSYTDMSSVQQDVFLEEILDGFWQQVSNGDVDLELFADALNRGIKTQHVKLYSGEGADQGRIAELDIDGNYDTLGPHSQMVFNINYGANKIDYFLHRAIDTSVELQSDGTATVTTEVSLENRAPSQPPSLLIGLGEGVDPGVNRMTINLLVPPGSAIETFEIDGRVRQPFTYTDDRSPVAWDVLQLGPGETVTVSLTYSIPGAIQTLGENTAFDLVLFPQATVNPDRYSLSITPPPGVNVLDGPGVTSSGALEMSGTLDEPVSVRMQMGTE